MARHDIRGLKLSDGTYAFSSKDVYNINDNFIQLSQEVFGNSSFTRKIEKRVTEAEEDIETIEQSVSDLDGNIASVVVDVNGIRTRVENSEGDISTLTQTANSIQTQVSDNTGNISSLTQTASSIEAKINTTTHSFTQSGYTLRDVTGSALITPNGVANEQNLGRVDNVEAGYPMKIPFHIGSEVSQITQAVLKWDMSQFRTYSKGAASGGGVRTTPSGGGSTSGSGGSTTVSVRDWTQGLAASTSNATITSSNLGQPHYHTVSTSNLGHRHDIPSHTHTTPSHSHSLDIEHEHAPVFGILETGITVDYIIGITIDGVWRAQVNATRGEIDLSAWITTNGWHELILSVNGIKRLDANLFLKTYIRR